MDQAGYSALRISPNREDRKAAMSTFFGALGGFGRTFGTTMNSQVQKSLFYSRARKYSSNLEAALNGPNIPVSVYMRLIEGVNKSLPTFHRYLKLRKRMMGLKDDLHYYDLYAPLVAEVDLKVHAGGGAGARGLVDGAARLGLHRRAAARVQGALARLVSRPRARCRAPTRTAAPTTCTRTCC